MALSKLAVRRLTKLVEHMESRPKSAAKHFSMDVWFGHNDDGTHDHGIQVGTAINAKHLHQCGTTACAMGFAAAMPYFKKLGLEVRKEYFSAALYLNGARDTMFNKVEALFEIDFDQATTLFGADNRDRSPQSWAKRARGLMKKWAAA